MFFSMLSVQRRAIILLLGLFVLTGCETTKSKYYWGEYEQIIYDMYIEPGKADAGTQVEKLTRDIQKAQDNDQLIPPGLYAHLGLVYAMQGNMGQAIEAFNQEKISFPESAVLVDGMIHRYQTTERAQASETE